MKRALVILFAAGCASAPARPPEASRAEPAAAPPAQTAAAPQGTPDAPFRAQPPPPTPPAAFQAPVPKQLKLKNGLDVYFIERRDVPLVAIDLAIDSGADTNPPGKAGLASFTLDMLDEGTPGRDATAVARAFEDLAARYRVAPDADASHLIVTALAAALDPTLEIFADVALHPAFREADLERVRQQRLGEIAQQLDDPAAVGQNVLGRVLYGDKHPWGFPADGTVKSIRALKRGDLAAWHAGAFQPRNASLFVVGDVSEAELVAALEKHFGAWKNGQAPKPQKLRFQDAKTRVVYVVDKPDAPQSQIWLGEMGVASNAPDVFPVRVMNAILGGTFNSRLNGNLRTEHAYSYGVFSFYDTHREGGPFIASGGVVSDKTAEALAEFVKEIDKMKSGEVSDGELDDAKDGLMRAIPAFFASNEAASTAFARSWSHGLPLDYYARYQDRVRAVTKADVAKAARDRLHPDTMQIVVVGPLQLIQEKVAALKLGNLQIRDAEGEAAAAVGKK